MAISRREIALPDSAGSSRSLFLIICSGIPAYIATYSVIIKKIGMKQTQIVVGFIMANNVASFDPLKSVSPDGLFRLLKRHPLHHEWYIIGIRSNRWNLSFWRRSRGCVSPDCDGLWQSPVH